MVTLEWREQAPIVKKPRLRIWSSLLPEEAAALREQAHGRKCLEIGTAFGYSTLVLASVAEHVWAIDPHDLTPAAGLFNFAASSQELERYKRGTLPILKDNLREAGLEERVTIIQARSEDWLKSVERRERYRKTGISFAFIDGNHSFDIATQDLFNCAQVVGPGGVIALHDYNESNNPGVKQAIDGWRAHWTGKFNFTLTGTLALLWLR